MGSPKPNKGGAFVSHAKSRRVPRGAQARKAERRHTKATRKIDKALEGKA